MTDNVKLFSLVNTYAKLKLKSEAKKTYLSYLWWLLEPVLYVLAFYFVFAVIMKSGREDFIVFLMVGKIPFLWFSKSISGSCTRIKESKPLLTHSGLRLELLPLVDLWQNSYKQLVTLIALLVFVVSSGYSPGLAWFSLIVVTLAQFAFMLPLALILAWLTAFVPDVKMLISMFVLMMMFLSGIFWDVSALEPSLRHAIIIWNPLAFLIEAYRDILMKNQQPDWAHLMVLISGCFIMTIGCFKFFEVTQNSLIKRVLHS